MLFEFQAEVPTQTAAVQLQCGPSAEKDDTTSLPYTLCENQTVHTCTTDHMTSGVARHRDSEFDIEVSK